MSSKKAQYSNENAFRNYLFTIKFFLHENITLQ